MGQFVNPGNDVFAKEARAKIYVDKSGLIRFTNSVMNTPGMFICSSRPRRFGKSYAADMLTAYYSCGCDSDSLFQGLEISHDPGYRNHLNEYDVIRFDVQWCRSAAESVNTDPVAYINDEILREMQVEYPEVDLSDTKAVFTAMNRVYLRTGRQFVVIIDEWDALIRDGADGSTLPDRYIDFLRGMFKGTEPMAFIRLAYMTGILPIKRQQTQSALNNFHEYTMIQPGPIAEYIGFTDREVQNLCQTYGMDYEEMRRWYDGYQLKENQIYNPGSVCKCLDNREAGIYWTATASFRSIRNYINMDFDGMKTALIEMTAGTRVPVNTGTFENYVDKVAFKSRDDVFTYMIHLGYLTYDSVKREAMIPNEEIRQVLAAEIRESRWTEYESFQNDSDALLEATIAGDEKKVAESVEKVHDRYASAIWYNNENSLASTVSIAYLSTLKYYFKPVREMPTGKGFADLVYLPLPAYRSDLPALLIELKWNSDAETALNQIREKKYPKSVREYAGEILLIGINYDRKGKKHTCRILQVTKETAG